MANNLPDVSFKGGPSSDALIAAYQHKFQLEQEARVQNQQIQASKQQSWMQIANQAGQAVSDTIASVKNRQKKDFINTLADSLSSSTVQKQNAAPVTMGGTPQQVPTASYNPDLNVTTPNVTPVAVYDPQKAASLKALGNVNPEALTTQYAKSVFKDPNEELVKAQTKSATLQGKVLENQLKVGRLGEVPDTVKKMLATQGMQIPDGMSMADLKAAMPGMSAGMRAGVLGEMAKARGDQVTANLADKMGTDINPAKWTPGSPGGVAAQRVTAAKDAKSLFQTIREQPDGPTKRQTVEAAIATVKTLMGSGNGMVSEKIINDMIPQTARGKFAGWEEFLQNNPAGNDQQKFMDQFEHQIDRVNEVNSGIVDDRIRQAISTHKVLHGRDPEAWNAQIQAAGLDPADIKGDVYKPQSIRRLRNTALGQANVVSGGGLNIDPDALTKELKRRGL